MCPRICQTLGCPSGPKSVGRAVTGVHSRAAPLPTFLSLLRGAQQGPPQGLEGPRAEEQPCWAPPWSQRVCRVWGAPQKPDPRGRDSRLLHTTPQGSGLRSYGQMSARGLVAGLRGGAQCWGGWRSPLTSRTSGGGGLWQRLTWAVQGEACGWAWWGTGTGGCRTQRGLLPACPLLCSPDSVSWLPGRRRELLETRHHCHAFQRLPQGCFPGLSAKEGPAEQSNVSGTSGSESGFLQPQILFSPAVAALSINKGLFEQ